MKKDSVDRLSRQPGKVESVRKHLSDYATSRYPVCRMCLRNAD